MVGLVISMLVGLTAFGSLQTFSAMQRLSAGVGGTLGTGVSTLGVLKYELAQAGRGLYVDGVPVCTGFNLSSAGKVLADGVNLRPVEFSWDEAGQLTLDVRYASALEAPTPVATTTPVSKDGVVELNGLLPVAPNQAVLLAPAAGTAGLCTIRTVTQVTAATADFGQQLTFGATGGHNAAAFTTTQAYAEGSRVFLIGSFEHVRFQHVGTNFVMSRPLLDRTATLAENVRGFSFNMGATDGLSETVSAWTPPVQDESAGEGWADLTVARTAQLRALRVGLVMQAPQKEKPDAEGKCKSTPAADTPLLFGEKVPLADDGACFKYRALYNVAPLRNIARTAVAS